MNPPKASIQVVVGASNIESQLPHCPLSNFTHWLVFQGVYESNISTHILDSNMWINWSLIVYMKFKVHGPYAVTLLNCAPIFETSTIRMPMKNVHQKTCVAMGLEYVLKMHNSFYFNY